MAPVSRLGKAVARQHQVEGKLARAGRHRPQEAQGSLLQQQGTAQVRALARQPDQLASRHRRLAHLPQALGTQQGRPGGQLGHPGGRRTGCLSSPRYLPLLEFAVRAGEC